MMRTCAKCGKIANGNYYRIYYGKAQQTGSLITYSDMKSEDIFLCDSCAVSTARTSSIVLTICLGIVGLFMGILFVGGISTASPDEYGAVTVMGLITLICFVPLYWTIKKLITLEPTRESGEGTAISIRIRNLMTQGYTVWTGKSFEALAARNPQLQLMLFNQLNDLTGQQAERLALIELTCPHCNKATKVILPDRDRPDEPKVKCENCKKQFVFRVGMLYKPIGYV